MKKILLLLSILFALACEGNVVGAPIDQYVHCDSVVTELARQAGTDMLVPTKIKVISDGYTDPSLTILQFYWGDITRSLYVYDNTKTAGCLPLWTQR